MALDRPNGLAGKRILIVEDEFYLADDLALALRKLDAEVIGPVGSLQKALAVLHETDVDCAILDLNLKGQMAFPIADRLEQSEIPFVVASGYTSAAITDRFKAVPRIEKPFDTATVMEAVGNLFPPAG